MSVFEQFDTYKVYFCMISFNEKFILEKFLGLLQSYLSIIPCQFIFYDTFERGYNVLIGLAYTIETISF